MKKLILVLVLGLFVFGAMAQRSYTLPENETFWPVALTAADTITDDAAVSWTLAVNKHNKLTQSVYVALDSLNAANVSVQLKGKAFAGEAYTNIGTAVKFAGTQADTSFVIANTTANRYRYLQLTVTGTGTQKTQVSALQFKVWNE